MTDFPQPGDAALARLRDLFADESAAMALTDETDKTPTAARPVTPGRLLAHLNGGETERDPEVEAALNANPALRAAQHRLLRALALVHVGAAMAASSDELPAREGGGCRIRFEASAAEAAQVYVIIELAEAATELVLVDRADHCHRFPLPPARGGIVQLIVDRQGELIRLLADPKTDVFLR